MVVLAISLLELFFVIGSSLNCNETVNEDISLFIKSKHLCPSTEVEVQCVVKNRTQHRWSCPDISGSGIVFCTTDMLSRFTCDFGDVNAVINECECGDPVMISTATLMVPPVGNTATLNCSSNDLTKSISVKAQELQTPTLNILSIIYNLGSDQCNVTIDVNSNVDKEENIEYSISLTNGYTETPITTTSVLLNFDEIYVLTVHSQICGGSISSNTSQQVMCPEVSISSLMPTPVPTSTMFMAAPTEVSSNQAVIVGGVSTAFMVVFLLAGLVSLFYIIWEKKNTEIVHKMDAMCIVNGELYYSGRRKVMFKDSYCYFIGKYIRQTDKTKDIISQNVGFVRGIAFDGTHFYVVDSANHKVLKFNKKWKKVEETDGIFRYPYGVLVRDNMIFVCDTQHNKIVVLDSKKLNCCNDICFPPIESPKGIAFFKEKYFITSTALTYGKILIYSIEGNTVSPMGDVNFEFNLSIRDLCVCGEYLFVTESEGRLLSFGYEGDHLKLVHSTEGNYPDVIACDKDMLLIS